MLHVVQRIDNQFELVAGHDILAALSFAFWVVEVVSLLERDVCCDVVPLLRRIIAVLADLKSPGRAALHKALECLRVDGELGGPHGEMAGSVTASRKSGGENEAVFDILQLELAGDLVDAVLEEFILGHATVNKHKKWIPGLLGPRYCVGQLPFKTLKGALHRLPKLLDGTRSAELKGLRDAVCASAIVWSVQENLVRPFLVSVHVRSHFLLLHVELVQHFLERFRIDLDTLELLHDGPGGQLGDVEFPLLAASRGTDRVGYAAIVEAVVGVSV